MLGSNESTRVAASKVLMDTLADPASGCPERAARMRLRLTSKRGCSNCSLAAERVDGPV
jgi:hypothetical protein